MLRLRQTEGMADSANAAKYRCGHNGLFKVLRASSAPMDCQVPDYTLRHRNETQTVDVQ